MKRACWSASYKKSHPESPKESIFAFPALAGNCRKRYHEGAKSQSFCGFAPEALSLRDFVVVSLPKQKPIVFSRRIVILTGDGWIRIQLWR
jgi:hypothetical protein